MKNPGTPYRLEMRADSLSSNEEVSDLSKAPQEEFSLRICMWEGPCVLCFKRNGPRDALIGKMSKFPCRVFKHTHRSYHKWKDVWVPCRDPTESPRPPLHIKNGPNMPLTTRNPRGVHCFKWWRGLIIFNTVRNPSINVSNRKRYLNSHLTSRSVRIVLPRIVYIPEVSLIPIQVSSIHWTNSSFEWTSPP